MPRLTVGRVTAAVGLLVATVRLLAPTSLHLFDLKMVDVRHLLRGPLAPAPEVVIVAIDEDSLAALGRWPWPRTRLAGLVDAIDQAGPSAIGLDIVFDTRDEAIDMALVDDAIKAAPNRSARAVFEQVQGAGDRRLSETLRRSGHAVLAFFFEFEGPREKDIDQEVLGLPELSVRTSGGAEVSTAALLLDGRRLHRPLAEFAEGAGDGGHINFLPDVDGVHRRVPLAVRVGERLLPALNLQLVRRHLGGVAATAVVSPFEMTALTLGDRSLPINGAGQLSVNYLGPPKTVPHLSAADVVAGRIPREAIAGRIVLVGFTAAGFDDVTTPFAPVSPGVELQATVIDNMLHGRALWRPWWSVPVEALLIVLAGLATGTAVRRFRGAGGLVAAALVVAYLGASQVLFTRAGLVLGAIYPLIGTFVCALAAVAFQATREEREKRRIRDAFSHYLNPEVTEMVADDPSRLRLGGDRCDISVLFSDIRGFTTISEQLDPEALGAFLNEYLTAMTDVVFRHDGLLDKYVGDAVMAFWGAPIVTPDHAARCCAAALEMQDEVRRLNEEWGPRGLPVIEIRIGVATGSAVVGNFGSERRFSYTAVGDTVNLASRLEGLNKTHGTHLLIADATRQKLDERFECRPVGEVTVRGRTSATGVFELLGRRPA